MTSESVGQQISGVVKGMKLSEPIIQIEKVTKYYEVEDRRIAVLRGVSLSIDTGEFVAIVGPSGNGKSTLLNLITGIDKASGGSVCVAGTDVQRLNESQLASWRSREIGIVFQFFQMLPGLSLLQNVMLPMGFAKRFPARQHKDRALDLLKRVGLSDQIHKLPSMVSGGQQQRAAIARALANDPGILIADEPTGNLDANTSEDVFKLFADLVEGNKTIVMVTHNMDMAKRMPRMIEIVNGKVDSDTNNLKLMGHAAALSTQAICAADSRSR